MDATSIQLLTSLVSNVGFPIAACGALFWKMNKDETLHKTEIDGLQSSLECNTTILTKLSEKLGESKSE